MNMSIISYPASAWLLLIVAAMLKSFSFLNMHLNTFCSLHAKKMNTTKTTTGR